MAKIAFIGAGSLGFTRRLVRDVLTFDLLRDAEIALMDIDSERLEFARRACETDRGALCDAALADAAARSPDSVLGRLMSLRTETASRERQ